MKETPDSTSAKPSKEVSSKDNEESDGSDSSGSLVEIRLNEYVKKSELSDFDLRAIVVRCSSCNRQINHFSYKDFKKHRKLGVITCKECYDFYGSSEFSQDESGYNYCTWCGNGGNLVVCDYCPNGFCGGCIRRNFGRSEIAVTNKEGWKCYVCDQKRLKPKVTFCDLIINLKEKSIKADKKKPAPSKKTIIAEKWLQEAFDSSEEACKNFHRKMTKLKSIGVAKSKSLKHIVKKMEEIINAHKNELKQVTVTLTKNFDTHIEQKRKEQDEQKTNIITLDATNEDSISDCIVLDPPSQEVGETNDFSPSLLQKKDKSEEEKIQAKLSLLKSSSDSNDEEESPLSVDHPCNGEINASEAELTHPNKSDTENKTLTGDTSNNTAARKLSFSSSGSSDNEEDKPKIAEIVKEVDRHIEEQDISHISDDEKYNPESHPKLKQEVKINLIRCDRLLKDGQSYIVFSELSDAEDKIDKIIDSLCKFPRKKRVTKPPTGKRRSGPFTKAAAKKELLESSSSISLSSEDEDQKKIQIEKKIPLKPKSPEIEEADSASSSISLNSDSEKEETTKKGKKPNKKKSDDSSDDFVPVKKKRKFDKLLHGRLSSDEGSDSKPKEKKEKKGPRKRKLLSSDEEKKEKKKSASSATTSSSDEEKGKKQTKKRRRIKKVGSSSEDGDSSKDDPNKTTGTHRKNIRKLLSQKKLAGTTKEAQLEEKERRKRIQERQKLYNKMEDFSADGKVIITRKMVLEVDPDSKEEVVQIHPDLVCKLKPHQVEGVKFMWECTIESTKDLEKPGSGCILAHCMGLGKTLQVIAFLHTCLTNKIVNKQISRGMIICPYNTALNWASEFNYWLDDVEGDVKVHQITSVRTNLERLDILNYWFDEGGVVILSYDIFRRLSSDKIPKIKKKDKEQFHKCLLDPGPDIVVCDEGHILKNEKSGVSIATSKLATRRRIVLTGTPLQNNLIEYHCMLSFVKPNLLGTVKEFRNRFVNPIINGQYDDSNEYDVKLMKKRIHILHKLLEGCVQRCDYSALTKFLPPKHEFVISVKLSEIQMKMYECYLEKLTTAKLGSKIQGSTLFVDFNNLRHIWTHPFICHVNHEKQEIKKLLKEDGDETFINDESVTEESATSSDDSDDDKLVEKIKNENKRKIKTRSQKKDDEEEESDEEEKGDSKNKQWYHEFITEEDKYNHQLSGKIVLLLEILKECERIGDKIILFSQSLLSLDFIEDVLFTASSTSSQTDTKDQDVIGTWIKGLDYFRMDGTTSADFRKSYIDMFNDPSNERSRLFLISTKAGSLGTNLIGANRVIIFDTSWNPSHDVQAIFRVYRFGQIKPVYIYRLLAQGTMEEKIYDRQVTKLSLSCRVVDEQQIDRHFSAADLAELYTFDRNATTQRPTPMVPKDRLLAELLIKNSDWIITYHEHDSLLQSQNEEDLTEEERQAAWNEYETERDKPAPNINANMNTFDLGSITKEPDFTQDYEGKMIPDMKEIVNDLFQRLTTEVPLIKKDPLEFKKKLLTSVYAVRQAFQEKHVKILRLKQEYCTRGTVPNAVNKYMDELAVILKSSGEYITRLSSAIVQEQKKLQQQQAFKQATGVPPTQQPPIYRTRYSNVPPTGFPAGFIFRGVPTASNRMYYYPQNTNFNPNNNPNLKTYMTTPTPNTTTTKQNVVITEVIDSSSIPDSTSDSVTVQAPIITEVDDTSSKPTKPSSANSTNHQSTVVIQEIP